MMTFEAFLHAEMPALARFAGALTNDRYLADDILSDALLIASRRWRRIAAMDNPVAYVRRIVVTTFLSDRRKAQRRRSDSTADQGLLDTACTGGQDAVAQRAAVKQLLEKLPPAQRAAIVLRYVLDQTDAEIAATLNCAESTVRSHLSHARSTLRMTANLKEGLAT